MILAVNCYSVNLATNVQNIFTAAKLVAIAIIVCGGAYKLILGNASFIYWYIIINTWHKIISNLFIRPSLRIHSMGTIYAGNNAKK